MWALGNIAGENTEFRDMVIDCGMLPELLRILNTSTKMSVIKNCCWALSNLIRGKPQPEFAKLRDVLIRLESS